MAFTDPPQLWLCLADGKSPSLSLLPPSFQNGVNDPFHIRTHPQTSDYSFARLPVWVGQVVQMAAIYHSCHCIVVLAGDNRRNRLYPTYRSHWAALDPGTFGYFRVVEQTVDRYGLHSYFLEVLLRLAETQSSH